LVEAAATVSGVATEPGASGAAGVPAAAADEVDVPSSAVEPADPTGEAGELADAVSDSTAGAVVGLAIEPGDGGAVAVAGAVEVRAPPELKPRSMTVTSPELRERTLSTPASASVATTSTSGRAPSARWAPSRRSLRASLQPASSAAVAASATPQVRPFQAFMVLSLVLDPETVSRLDGHAAGSCQPRGG